MFDRRTAAAARSTPQRKIHEGHPAVRVLGSTRGPESDRADDGCSIAFAVRLA
jgi:hypothetical protein